MIGIKFLPQRIKGMVLIPKTKHQKPMINRKPRLPKDTEEESDKEKFIKKNKDNMIYREVKNANKQRA